ncbi:flagellar biosynthetic protein FlhF [Thermocrinis albus DSM 14484]|uniref:Flagellar biosynthesis protein FlhF n=1 Tax=Thermocrinis albus (strain DSM 14484 / JCM 11386 / HI 11/12) TaxID=638303 RepID=D3SM19_THEAH|nr:flagellar biosynthesis protein FlhF [Thermocrinis albus]ADC89799.1 flagellar biosynthetic protein FlhF [Thermocrinis albus DSM 14484]
MKIKKFMAESLQKAVEEVRAIYGPDAVILSTRIVKKRIIPFLPFPRRSFLEVTVGLPDTEDFAYQLKKQEDVYAELEKLKETLKEVLQTMKRPQVEEEKNTSQEEYSMRATQIMKKLLERGVARDVAKAIMEAACGYDYEIRKLDLKGEVLESLTEGIERNVPMIKEPMERWKDFRVIALLGPTGVGKTTTLAKLAYVLKKSGKRIGVITVDSYRVGAREQLRTYAHLMEIPFRIADTPQKLRECVGELSSMDLLLVDTAGRSQYDEMRIRELATFFHRLPTVELYLTLSANTDERIMYEAVEHFSFLPLEGLVFTKVDETAYFGNIINVAFRTKLPILCFTNGQRVPEDIVLANGRFLAQLLLEVNHGRSGPAPEGG